MSEIVIGAQEPSESSAKPTATRDNEVIITSGDPSEPAAKPAPAEPADDPAKKPEEGQEDDAEPTLVVGDCDMSALAEEYESNGSLSEESYAELAEHGYPKDLVDTYIAGLKARAAEGQALGEKAQADIYEAAGGEKKYNDLIDWAEKKLSTGEKESYNKAVNTGDTGVIKLAVQGLVAKYEQTYGREPKLVKGSGGGKMESKGYDSQQEMIQAMSDPRYGRDAKYTKDVEEKTVNSAFLKQRGKRS